MDKGLVIAAPAAVAELEVVRSMKADGEVVVGESGTAVRDEGGEMERLAWVGGR